MKKTMLVVMFFTIALVGHSQSRDSLIADETWFVPLKTNIKIMTYNEEIYNKLTTAKENIIRDVMINFSTPKRYNIYLKAEYKEEVMKFFDTLNKKK